MILSSLYFFAAGKQHGHSFVSIERKIELPIAGQILGETD
jgi:hypothetical protein